MNKLGRIRPDGKAVVFSSRASNLVTGDTNGQRDVFIRDLVANTTKRISLTGTGGQVHDAYPGVDYSTDGKKIGWFRNECDTAACSSGTGYLMQWSAATGKSVVVAAKSWSESPFSIGPIRAGLNAAGVSSWGEHYGYSSIATPTSEVYGFDCETCAFDIAASGTVGALGESTNLKVHQGQDVADVACQPDGCLRGRHHPGRRQDRVRRRILEQPDLAAGVPVRHGRHHRDRRQPPDGAVRRLPGSARAGAAADQGGVETDYLGVTRKTWSVLPLAVRTYRDPSGA